MGGMDKEDEEGGIKGMILSKDEGGSPETTAEGIESIKPVFEGKTISAGNASQLSDGASACVVMSDKIAAKKGLNPLGIFRGFVAAGAAPDAIGAAPVPALPRLPNPPGPQDADIPLA